MYERIVETFKRAGHQMPCPSATDCLLNAGCVPRAHYNGFVQVDIVPGNEDLRLHVWDPRVPRQRHATPIHDHAFDMRSEVLYGHLRDVLLALHVCDRPTHEVWQVGGRDGLDTVLAPTGASGRLAPYRTLELVAGDQYTINAFELHESQPQSDVVVTLMTKTHRYADSEPRVLVPCGQQRDTEFRKGGHDIDLLWTIVREAIG